MYRVIAKDKGKCGNIMMGARYCFRKKSVAQLITLFTEHECAFTIERFVRIHGDTFCWSNSDISAKIWNMAGNMLAKSKQK